jgi:outer membrane protein assembly factor BamB
MRLRLGLPLLALAACGTTPASSRPVPSSTIGGPGAAEGPAESFSFAQISDTHFEPRFAGDPPVVERGAETFRWLREVLREPQHLEAAGIEAPAPAIVLLTGDVTEFGSPGTTWSAVEAALDALGPPVFAVPGNHDATWVPIGEGMRQRYGGWSYSFDARGCHFVALNSATLQEPLPSLSCAALSWLRLDLEHTPRSTPVFLFLHHPPDAGEFAPSQLDELRDALDGFDLALVLHGHGHAVGARRIASWDCVQGGSTFSKDPATDARGYNLISIERGVLRVAFRYLGDAKPPLKLLEKPLAPRAREPFFIASPKAHEVAQAGSLQIAARTPHAARPAARVDGEPVELEWSTGDGLWRAKLSTAGLEGGAHRLSLTCLDDDGSERMRTRTFLVPSQEVEVLWRRILPSGIRAAPLISRELLLVATGAGEVLALDRASGAIRWHVPLGAEVIGAPAAERTNSESGFVVVTGDGSVYALDREGKPRWHFQAGAAIYAPPLVDGGTVCVGDISAQVHALDLESGERRWFFDGARYSVEARAARWGELLVFGAWDGFLYALDARTGALRWRTLGAGSAAAEGSRYFAPADCPPAVLGGRVFACDRAWRLASFDAAGTREDLAWTDVAAIAASPDGGALTLRGVRDQLTRIDAAGTALWQTPLELGRFPVPPVEVAGRIAVCSDRGRVALVDAASGAVLWRWRATPDSYVMAQPALDEMGAVYVVALDGSISALRAREHLNGH